MVGNYYTLAALASSLDTALAGKAVGRIFSQEREELVVEFGTDDPALVVSCRAAETTCFLHGAFSRARRNSVELLADARRRVVARVWMPASDRTILVELRDGARLALRLYTPRSNVLLLDGSGAVQDAFLRAKELRGSGFASGDRSAARPLAMLLAEGPDAERAVRRWHPELGPVLARELVHRAGGNDPDALERAAARLLAELGRPEPRVFRDPATGTLLCSIVELHHLSGWECRRFDDLHEAVRHTVYRRRAMERFAGERSALLTRLRQTGERSARSLAALRADRGSRAADHARAGELILSRLHEIHPGSELLEVRSGASVERIRLDPRVSPARNAERYFEKARAARRAEAESRERGALLERRARLALELGDAVERCRDREQLEECMRRRRDDLTELGLTGRDGSREEIPFRVFTVEGGFQVWAGKNSANNDLLTLRYARPADLWFHARGSGGSHVVLRTGSAPGTPGKRARQQAASIAAYYSKMRTASVVPVTVTEKKHVRKPRGAPPGTVLVEREAVIFAAPALPDSSATT